MFRAGYSWRMGARSFTVLSTPGHPKGRENRKLTAQEVKKWEHALNTVF
jgi:hypothetical protein